MSAFSEEQKTELQQIVVAALQSEAQHRRAERLKLESTFAKEEALREKTALYLITMTGNVLGFPDSRGKCVLHHSVYARVTTRSEYATFMNCSAEVLAFSDGELLETTFKIQLNQQIAALVELPDNFLQRLAVNAPKVQHVIDPESRHE